jgi:hypothetical protein
METPSFILVNLNPAWAIPSSSANIAPTYDEFAPNSWLFLHKLASINAILAALDAFNA